MKKSIITDDMEHCMLCGSPYVEIHHAIYGVANRKLSDKYHLIVPLCHEHHTGDLGVHFNKPIDKSLKRLAQTKFEEHYPDLDFVSIFGRNYI